MKHNLTSIHSKNDREKLALILLSALGPNDAASTEKEIANHKKAQRDHEMNNKQNQMQFLHIIALDKFSSVLKASNVTYSIDIGGGVTLHGGIRSGSTVWLIENAVGGACAALYAETGSKDGNQCQPFEADCFYAIDREILNQTIQESEISDSCNIGNGIVVHSGIRNGGIVWLLQNAEPEGLCAAWYDVEET